MARVNTNFKNISNLFWVNKDWIWKHFWFIKNIPKDLILSFFCLVGTVGANKSFAQIIKQDKINVIYPVDTIYNAENENELAYLRLLAKNYKEAEIDKYAVTNDSMTLDALHKEWINYYNPMIKVDNYIIKKQNDWTKTFAILGENLLNFGKGINCIIYGIAEWWKIINSQELQYIWMQEINGESYIIVFDIFWIYKINTKDLESEMVYELTNKFESIVWAHEWDCWITRINQDPNNPDIFYLTLNAFVTSAEKKWSQKEIYIVSVDIWTGETISIIDPIECDPSWRLYYVNELINWKSKPVAYYLSAWSNEWPIRLWTVRKNTRDDWTINYHSVLNHQWTWYSKIIYWTPTEDPRWMKENVLVLDERWNPILSSVDLWWDTSRYLITADIIKDCKKIRNL